MTAEEREAQRFVRNYVLRNWFVVFWSMIKLNLAAYVRDTREGVRKTPPPVPAGES